MYIIYCIYIYICVCFFKIRAMMGMPNSIGKQWFSAAGEAMRSHPEEPGSGQMWGALSGFDLGGVLLM